MGSKPLTVFLVLSSEESISLIRNQLSSMGEGVSLRVARSAAEGRTLLASERPDLLLAGFELPDGSGLDLLPEGPDVPIFPSILLAPHRTGRFARAALEAGAMDYLPLLPAVLADLPYLIERTLREWKRIHRCREAEKFLRIREEGYRRLFENMNEALAIDEIICDQHGNPVDWRIVDINPAFEKILQISREQAVGRLASDLYGPAMDIAPILEVNGRVALSGVPAQNELYFPSSKRYLLVSVFSLGEGRFATLSTDISDRRKIEEENQRLLAELEATINAIAEAVIIYRPDGSIERMNPAAERLLGYGEEERDKPFAERIGRLKIETPGGEVFPLQETMQQVFDGDVLCGVISVLHRSDGRAVWMSNSAAPIRSPGGTLLGAVGVSTDITAVHELQEQRDLCLHSVSHDLRSPMTIIQGYAEVLRDKIVAANVEGNWRQYIEELLKGTQRMAGMIDDLVETARTEGGQIQLEKSRVRLDQLVADMVRSYAKVIDPGRLAIRIPESLPELFVDPERLERVLLNLLTNAMKYSPADSKVFLTAEATPDLVTIEVLDAGCGIDPEDLPRIFDRFFRGRSRRRLDSVGLGLFIAKQLVEAHGGWIGVESRLAAGSTFTVTLPRSGDQIPSS